MSKTFCPLPWISVAMRNNGDLRVCPHSHTSPAKGLPLKDDGSPFSAATDKLSNYRNSQLLKDIRIKMLQGQWHENCVRCQTETESGVRSPVQYERELRKDIITWEQAQEWTGEDGSIHPEQVPLALLDVRFGNQCNLSCRTCNPSESSLWYKDQVALYGDTFSYGGKKIKLEPDENGRLQIKGNFFDWYENHFFIEQLPEVLKNVSQIHMSGGEPLKTKTHLDFLKKIISLGYQERIILEYNTNGYLIPEAVWALWEQFKQVKIGISFDSIGKMNDYIRFPSQWDVLQKNIQRFDRQSDKFVIWLTMTVHCYNIFYLPEIIEWRILSNFKKINNFRESVIFSDHPLHNPKHLNVQILPLSVKEKISQKLAQFRRRLPDLVVRNDFLRSHPEEATEQIEKLLDSYTAFMMQSDMKEYFPKFLNYTQRLDGIRKESFASVFPDFQSVLSEVVSPGETELYF